MRGRRLVAVLLCTAQAMAWAGADCARAEPSAPQAPSASPTETAQAQPADPVVVIIRAKLADPAIRKWQNAEDLAALESFYGARTAGPLWMTDMGFSARGQAALFEIDKADEWGLEAKAFTLPQPGALPADLEAQALAEIVLDLAILKYVRFAQGGRFNPAEISELFDQTLPLDDPDKVLAEIEAADAPDAYLRSLHPKHEGFARLRQALVQARAKSEEGPKPENAEKPEIAERDMRRLILNLERWRWLPDDLGATYIWLNTPEFTLYVFKDGKEIYSDKTLVGTIGHATPVFSADLATIVFNPEWIAPESVREETIQPQLRSKNYDFFRKYRFSVRYRDRPVNVARVDWRRVDIDDFTFIQKPGPGNNLGKVKFLYPNEHDVYMHDTLPLRKKAFKEAGRDIGNGCVRMERPDKFAELLLAEDKQWPASRVKALWDKSVNEAVTIDGEFPVHTVYFTAVAGENSKVATFADVYGLDRKLATAMFGDDKGFPEPPPEKKRKQLPTSSPSRWSPDRGGVAGALDSFLD